MGIFKKTIKYSKPSKDLDNKIKNLDEELKNTGVLEGESDSEVFVVQEENKLPEIYDEIEVEKKEESLYNWREAFITEEVDETQNIVEETEYKTVRKVESYISESNKELIEIRDQVFQEISESTLLNLPEIKTKIEKVLEIYDQIQEGLLNQPPETKNEDPLTPLNQNFVTTEELNKHYTLFINRVQEQLATIGGGGETRLKYLDDIVGIATNPSAYNGKFLKYDHSIGKFVFATAGGGAGSQTLDDTLQLGNTSLLGMSVGLSTFNTVVVGGATTALVVTGDARITGILTIGTSSITLDGNTNQLRINNFSAINESGSATFSGIVTANTFVKSGGTSSQFLKADGSVDTATYATQTYVGLATVGLASVSYVNNQVGLATSGLASQTYVGLATVGLASVSYVNNQVGLATVGLASVSYVNNQVGLSTSGLLSSTGNGSNLTGIVTYITAGSGISINQNTGNVTITATGGGGGGSQTLNDTLLLGNTSSLGMSVGVVTASSFVGNLTGTATTATTVDILNTNGLTTIYYPTFVENRTDGQILRGDIDLTYRTDTNTLTVPNISATSFVKSGGTSSQFLKADGSVDTTTYASQTSVGLATVGLASVSYVNTQVGLATVGLLASTGNGSNLTGIVTFITAGNNISVSQNTGNVTITGTGVSSGSNTTYTGNNTFTGITTFNGNVFSTSVLQVQQVEETYNPYTATINAAAVVNLDCSTGNTFYITSTVNGNWTANLTNVAIGTSCLTNVTIMIVQGTTAYIPNALQIGGVSQTINWQGGSTPSGNNSKKDAIAFTIFYTGSVYNVFGQLVTFG